MGSCAAPSAKGDDKFITTDYLQQCQILLADPEMTVGAVAKRFNVSRMTIYRYTTKGNHSEKINDE
ncbi:helix-turn-helix domain-containing protein [Escherichia coli]|uniref:helix-turn-helix domain-containing protein n=1 Tax=Enterobacteriaceae TaxID=543 RepID=UPI0013665D33|nr:MULTISPECIES: helix-turn-helix domain-containing protein [Enterobacteriaceae]NBY77837.1 helix-turn-helix domain-containing protein [Escherichia coli]NNS64120.1 helix-turn-helix domain-containing protein [Escherichia coli]NNS92492.1 helix-turn-helix domain-containing protein [Escherichia coli]NNS95856.1 helix-turn-helix domain-containing protein [Escherichia coli]NNT11967.1 helix-turn-helix domain-containing protein [Escherichia coli]